MNIVGRECDCDWRPNAEEEILEENIRHSDAFRATGEFATGLPQICPTKILYPISTRVDADTASPAVQTRKPHVPPWTQAVGSGRRCPGRMAGQ